MLSFQLIATVWQGKPDLKYAVQACRPADLPADRCRPVRAAAAGVIRPFRLFAAVAVAALALAGCNYQNRSRLGGATGVTVDAAGKPVLLVAVCKGQFENVYLSTTDQGNVVPIGGAAGKGGADRASTDIGEWQTQRVADKILEVPVLSRPAAQWSVTAAPASLRPGVTYTAYAESTDTKWQATQVSFTLADLKTLDPAKVRVGQTTTARATFHQQACGS